MRRNLIVKIIAFSVVIAMLFVGCGGAGGNAAPETKPNTETKTETENEEPKLKEMQSLSSSYQNVGGIVGNQKIVNYHPIPDICAWDATQNAFVAPDNGTNENGESIVIQVKCEPIDNSEKYTDNLVRIESMLNENKDTYTASGLSYLEETGYEVIAYYYATEEIVNRDGKDYVHTVGVFELLRYTREHCIDPYTATTFTVDVVKPADVDKTSVYKYFDELFDSVEMGYTDTK